MKILAVPGATPLDDETLQGLIPGLGTQGELDEFEASNIARAMLWADTSRTLRKDLLSISGLKLLHRKMFGDTWRWAGEFRKRQTNIGVVPNVIQSDLAILLGDIQFWMLHQTYSLDEIAIRFHHRLVWIHPFPNGNGRFSRYATDLFLSHHDQVRFSWGKSNIGQNMGQSIGRFSDLRNDYIRCLKIADKSDDYQPLLKFAKS